MFKSVRCMWMRSGTSKGGYFLAEDLPKDIAIRDQFLLSIMGSPDQRQIDGMGGADPLTSKVALVNLSSREGIDVDYLFLQVVVDKSIVSSTQNCGNILAGVGPFAIERGLIPAKNNETTINIFMENTGKIAIAKVKTPKGIVSYEGKTHIDGVPGKASPIQLFFKDMAGSTCRSLLPTGNVVDVINGIEATCIDNGMPTVVILAKNLGIIGDETRQELDDNLDLKEKLESIRLKAGSMMNLGDVRKKTIPKLSLVSAPYDGGMISTRTFIPHRCHASIGVLCANSVATACILKGSTAEKLVEGLAGRKLEIKIEHPSGKTTVVLKLDENGNVEETGLLRTARKLFDGEIFA
ncbi:MAG: 4-oxalomesaconate tautomerase [Emcibacteraceae bacterium]|nr:4-oxalomesaconate tautomerase [Emcibacteraceae bacterium]